MGGVGECWWVKYMGAVWMGEVGGLSMWVRLLKCVGKVLGSSG